MREVEREPTRCECHIGLQRHPIGRAPVVTGPTAVTQVGLRELVSMAVPRDVAAVVLPACSGWPEATTAAYLEKLPARLAWWYSAPPAPLSIDWMAAARALSRSVPDFSPNRRHGRSWL